MRYTVLWTAAAQQELAALWLAARDRERISEAATAIDSTLERDADKAGESRFAEFRILFVAPLGIYYHVTAADRAVRVTAVWRF